MSIKDRMKKKQIILDEDPFLPIEEEKTPQQTLQGLAQDIQEESEEPQLFQENELQPVETEDKPLYEQLKEKPMPEGIAVEKIAGIPVDWSDLERYTLKVSPGDLTSAIRQSQSRIISNINKYRTPGQKAFSGKLIWIIIIAAIMLTLGVILMMYGPELMNAIPRGV